MGNQLTHIFTSSSRRCIARRPAAAAREAPASSAGHLSALLADCDFAVTRLSASIPAIASLAADLVARNDESRTATSHKAASYRSALLARKTRVLGSAKRLSRKQRKRIVADLEAADVSTEQLRVWSAVARADCLDISNCYVVCGLDCAFASPLLAVPHLVRPPVIGVCASTIKLSSIAGDLGSAVAVDGLRVMSATGPGLKWFKPHSRNEFRVELVQADDRVPAWLKPGDVTVAVLAPDGTAATGSGGSSAAVTVESEGHGTLGVMYGGLREDALEALLEVTVCGVPVACALVDGAWSVCVPRKALADSDHECVAVGKHIRNLPVGWGTKRGMAVRADEKWLVVGVSEEQEGILFVYSLPGGELVRTIGGTGSNWPLRFTGLGRMCFAPNGNLIVVDDYSKRLLEVMLEGVFVRFIGDFRGVLPSCVAVHDDVIAVGCFAGTGPRVGLFDFDTGSVTSRFGEVGSAPGQLSENCTGIRFTPDGSHLIIAESQARRLSVFITAGVFVRCVGVGVLGERNLDVVQSVIGEFVVADYVNHRVCVLSPDGSEMVRSWGERGTGYGYFDMPIALAVAGRHLYVIDLCEPRVQVFE